MVDAAAMSTDLTDEPAAHVRHVGPSRYVHGSDSGHRMIGVRHLLFDIEVGRGSQTLHDEVRPEITRRIDGQTRIRLDSHGGQVRDTRSGQAHSSVEIDDTRWLARIVHGGDHDRTEQFDRLFDDVEMSDVERVETPGIQGGEHRRGGHAPVKVPVRAASVRRRKVTQVRL